MYASPRITRRRIRASSRRCSDWRHSLRQQLPLDRIGSHPHPLNVRVLREEFDLRVDEMGVLEHLEPWFAPRIAELRSHGEATGGRTWREAARPGSGDEPAPPLLVL